MAPGSSHRLRPSSGNTPTSAIQACRLKRVTPPRSRISTVLMARKNAEASISSSDSGLSSTSGSSPSTSTPPKLSAIAVPVRQAKRSPRIAQASSTDIGT